MSAENKTEKATPKKRDDARKKGQVARSADLNGAAVLLCSLLVLSAFAGFIFEKVAEVTRRCLALITTPDVVGPDTVWRVFAELAPPTVLAILPVAVTCLLAGGAVAAMQVGFKPAPQALKPDAKRINPFTNAKNLFGQHALFEAGKSTLKVGAVGAIAALAVFPRLQELGALVGLPPAALAAELGSTVLHVAQRAAAAYLVIGVIDFAYQRWRHEKQLRMDRKEVKDELKQQGLPAEVRAAQRRKAMQLAQLRMMDAVPTADVVVTNPTHYSVALKYDAGKAAPEVVAKGMDHLALRIREVAREHGVPVVPDPPLARTLHRDVEVGRLIPEELYAAVAQVLAFVYRLNGRRAA